jgi:preprotein translocase subunit YajC
VIFAIPIDAGQAPLALWAQQPAPSPMSGLFMLWPVAVMVALYVLIVHRPQKREQAVRQDMLSNLKKNDHVLLNCGIFGVVTNIRPEADEVTIRVDESSNTKLRVTRGSVARVITDEPAEKIEGGTGN